MSIKYIIEREYVRFENNKKIIKKESDFTPEELNKIRLNNQKKYLDVLGYRGITIEEYKRKKRTNELIT